MTVRNNWRTDAGAALVVALGAVSFVLAVLWRRAASGISDASFDNYAYFYPNVVYALRALRLGHGLLWNSLQNCGEPFLGIISTALLYPLHAIFFVVGIQSGIAALTVVHLAIGGIGTYFLCRQLGVQPLSALCAALTFELNGITTDLASWSTLVLGMYAWLPPAMLYCERTLASPYWRNGCSLAAILAIQLLGGFPQVSMFTYEFIALRVMWEFISVPRQHLMRPLAVIGLALLVAPLLAAAQLLPSFEAAGQSLRSAELSIEELRTLSVTWDQFRSIVSMRWGMYANALAVVSIGLAALPLIRPQGKRIALFYFAALVGWLLLAFNTSVFDLYRRLPLGGAFREPARFLWCAGFTFSVLVGLGADAVMCRSSQGRRSPFTTAMAVLVGMGLLYWLSRSSLRPWEWPLSLATLVACAVAAAGGRGAREARVAVVLLLTGNLLVAGSTPILGFVKDESVFRKNAAAFDFVGERLTRQDRIYQFGKHLDFAIIAKSASVFGLPGISDYEPQASRRYAALWVRLLHNMPMRSINQFYYPLTYLPRNRALLNLLGTRYLVIDAGGEDSTGLVQHGMRPIWQQGGVRVYENLESLQRAFYVPRIKVVGDSEAILNTLAGAGHDPRGVALVEEQPADRFLGAPQESSGEVTFDRDRSEQLTLTVRATAEGFLFLSDQDYPGWEASVNGAPTPILRANFAFRVVRVPKGESTVVFRYRPRSVLIGAIVSAGTLLLLGAWCGLGWWRRRGAQAVAPV